ncbi:MAG TPA: ATP-dependent sacrificial sulfur transferase LarE [Actinocrinis sp.]|nr:ATP-dependent sacrificial sulfur transferase LarE [Actinocrinis sp.]
MPEQTDWLVESAAAQLVARLRAIGPIAVAYSGGTDSALVLAAAVRALGTERVLAVTAVSESLASGELEAAAAFAVRLGVRHLAERTSELRNPGYRANDRDRCYFCKSEVLDAIGRSAREHGFEQLATGTNADDAADPFRPGIRAGTQRGVHTPLRDCALTKAQVRRIAQHWDLPVWDKPATPCLASRIRYGVEVTTLRLAQVDRAENAVRDVLVSAGLSPRDLRVRHLGDGARIEVDPQLVTAVRDLPAAFEAVAAAGFGAVPVTVDGFESGRLNAER